MHLQATSYGYSVELRAVFKRGAARSIHFSKNKITLKDQTAVDSRFHAYIGKLSSSAVKEIVRKVILQSVFRVNPVGIVIVHPVNQDVVNLSCQSFCQKFRSRKNGRDHGISLNPRQMQFIKCS